MTTIGITIVGMIFVIPRIIKDMRRDRERGLAAIKKAKTDGTSLDEAFESLQSTQYTNMTIPRLDRDPLPNDWIEPLPDGRWKVEPPSYLVLFFILLIFLSGACFLLYTGNIIAALFKQNMTISLESIYIAGLSLVCLLASLILVFRTNSYYIIDTVRGAMLYHLQILPFERDFQVVKFGKIAGVAVLGHFRNNSDTNLNSGWFYRVVVVLKNKKKYRFTTDIAILQSVNEAADKLAQILKVKCWQCENEHTGKIEVDATTRNITVTYGSHDNWAPKYFVPNIWSILSVTIFLISFFYYFKHDFFIDLIKTAQNIFFL